MTKRKLTKLELKFANDNVESLTDQLEYVKFVEIPRIQLVLDTAELAVKKQIQDKEQELKSKKRDLEELQIAVDTLEDQIKNGVEPKENTDIETETKTVTKK